MKVLFVANVAKEHINKFHIPSIKYFKSQGCQVDVACCADAEVAECDHLYPMSWKRSPFSFGTFKGINELKRLVKLEKYDVVFCHTPVGGLVARLACRKLRKYGTKVAYCAHGLHFFKGAPLINWTIFYPIEKWLSKYTDLFITINKADYEMVKSRFDKKLNVILAPEVGVNFDRLKKVEDPAIREQYRKDNGIPLDVTVLIYVAELIPNKNQKMLIDALQIVHQKNENVYMLLVGPDHNAGKYQKYIETIGFSKYIKCLGWRNDIGNLMHSSDICVASSIREGFGINLVEAQYCGLPIVASNNRGHAMIIEDGVNGYLVENNDPEAMASRILELIDNKELYKKFSNVDVKKWDCNLIAGKLFEIVKGVYTKQ